MPSLVRIHPGPQFIYFRLFGVFLLIMLLYYYMPIINPNKIGLSFLKIFIIEIVVLTIVLVLLLII
jgi:hypothetical protein